MYRFSKISIYGCCFSTLHVYPSSFLSVCLCVCPLSPICLLICLVIRPSFPSYYVILYIYIPLSAFRLPFVCLSSNLSTCLPVCMSVCMYTFPLVLLPECVSVCPTPYVSTYLTAPPPPSLYPTLCSYLRIFFVFFFIIIAEYVQLFPLKTNINLSDHRKKIKHNHGLNSKLIVVKYYDYCNQLTVN